MVMDQNFSHLHPNPGWGKSKQNFYNTKHISPATDLVGKHCILELYSCDKLKLNDESFLRTSLEAAAKIAGAQLLNLITHRFHPQGVTGLALLAESHISIHTWPETGYAAVDVFTCGDHTMPEKACELLRNELLAESYSLKSFNREIPVEVITSNRKPILT